MTPTPHDALFKATFSAPERAAEVLRPLLGPELAAQIHWDSLVLQPGSFVDDALRSRHTDLLFAARLRTGHDLRVYLLLEHKSTPDGWVGLWLLKYMLRIWEGHRERHKPARRLPPIVPMVLYHGDNQWTAATEFSQLVEIPGEAAALRAFTPKFRYALADLTMADGEALRREGGSPLVRLVLLALKEVRAAGDLNLLLASWTRVLREVLAGPEPDRAVELIFSYLGSVRGEREIEAIDLQALGLGEQGEAIMDTTLGGYMSRARQAGRQEGRQAGMQEALLELLRSKFERVSPVLVARIEAAEADSLKRWCTRVLVASSLDEVFVDAAG